MKGLFIVYAPAIENNVLEIMNKSGIKHYTKFPYLHGIGGHSERHLDTHVWPGSNSAVLAVVDETAASNVLPGLKKIKEEFLDEGLKVFVVPMEVAI
ncbi:MAG: hypothetical protein NTZ10_06740 [Candidatus Saganbacteria bacterium]|nr:hypothetical protein [Candidatus Saganbacteria bacterium]